MEPPSGHRLGFETTDCESGSDGDRDGLSDACELELARAFAPVLVVSSGGCAWDASADPPRPAGGYLFGAAPAGHGRVRVAYLPAYVRDCGWSGIKCWIPFVSCEGHPGDSELVALELASEGRRWWVRDAFLSAHCGWDPPECGWGGAELLDIMEWVDGYGGAPVVYVARGKHGNYPTRAVCDGGHRWFDTCDHNDVRIRFPVDPRRNLGSRVAPIGERGCVTSAWFDPPVASMEDGREECFWTEVPFAGWQSGVEGEPATPYVRYLEEILGW